MNAAELKNTTGKTLDGGPITVYDANAYAGEALVETVKAGDKRLISYGVDLEPGLQPSSTARPTSFARSTYAGESDDSHGRGHHENLHRA